jgi:hypothetical protein
MFLADITSDLNEQDEPGYVWLVAGKVPRYAR